MVKIWWLKEAGLVAQSADKFGPFPANFSLLGHFHTQNVWSHCLLGAEQQSSPNIFNSFLTLCSENGEIRLGNLSPFGLLLWAISAVLLSPVGSFLKPMAFYFWTFNFWQLSIKFDQFLIQIEFGFGICVGNGIVAMISI